MMSIRTRFVLISLVSVALALGLAAWFFVGLFTTNLERRIDTELSGHLRMLAGSLELGPDGNLMRPDGPRDDRFFKAYGGLYWQITDPKTGREMRSASLFDYALPLPADHHETGTIHRYRLKGPEGRDVIVQERQLVIASPQGPRELRIAVAIDAASLDEASSIFAADILPYVAALGIVLVAMSALQLTIGLRPLQQMEADLQAIDKREAHSLPGPYPEELAGLARQLNQLLRAQEQALAKARARAADLAHGLKTPLTVIANHAQRLEDAGEKDIARELDMLAGTMLSHVEHELARARIAQNPDQRTADADLAKTLDGIVRTLKRTEAGEKLDFNVSIAPKMTLPIDPHDLRELMGNIVENASKWARSTINIEGIRQGNEWSIVTEDDGPGADDNRLNELTKRGIRLDHRMPGHGLGLAIVREIVDVYGLDMTLENRQPSGLRVVISGRS